MRIKKLNNNKINKSVFKRLQIVAIANLVLCSHMSYSNDLLSGTELKDSPLSLSLTTTATMTINGESQQLVVNQYGIHNKATVNQMANMGNSIAISQYGSDNLANLTQSGYGNTINLQQQGNNNFAEVIQDGNANIANVLQEGEQTFVVHQIGNDMVVNITQY
ncbi:curlin subunit CsgB [Thalassotalea piscium]|uniref:Minor curlin subunit n=1 Tax=Thalassotalea piscium TaxID=1230533 RepID=A0A7X0NK97_9GAMM|nr:curlin subunit CsgB [Thalassotalea piscium]MBB6544960.1 minor curlin subunit [Thalassotalea piscium]